MDAREVAEVLMADKLPPSYFSPVSCRRGDWLGFFHYDMPGPQWNVLIPVPAPTRELPGRVPKELIDLAEQVGHDPVVMGEKQLLEEIVAHYSLDEVAAAFEMTYLVPDNVPIDERRTDVRYKLTSDEQTKADFMALFETAFGDRKDGRYVLEEAMREGITRVIRMTGLGRIQHSFVGYVEDVPVSTGSVTLYNGKCFLYNVAAAADRRKEGLGGAMTKHLIEIVREQGISKDEIYIGTEPGTTVETFYKKLGCNPAFQIKGLDVGITSNDSHPLVRVGQ